MYLRLKNSLIALTTSVSLLLALGFASAPAPIAHIAAPQTVTSDLLHWATQLPARDDAERGAWLLAAVVAGTAIDAGRTQQRHNALTTQSNPRKRLSDRRLRMPFYSFAGQASRARES
jgi:hypothetical protein